MLAELIAAYRFAKERLQRYRSFGVVIIYIVHVVLANYLAFSIRFEQFITPYYQPQFYYNSFLKYLPFLIIIRLGFYLQGGHYKDLWRYSSLSDLLRLTRANTLGTVAFFVIMRFFFVNESYPRSIFVLDWMLIMFLSGGTRLMIRLLKEYIQPRHTGKVVILAGAGDAGEMLVRDMINNPRYNYRPIGFIDDDPHKQGLTIHGLPILGSRKELPGIIERYRPEEIYITMPFVGNAVINDIYNITRPYNIAIKILPVLREVGTLSVTKAKPLALEDLLMRDPVRTDIQSVKEFIAGKSVLVTGAGGSIGSELCRQILEYGPSRLVLFDRYENGLFQIDNELYRMKRQTFISSVVGDMRDDKTLDYLFTKHRPQIVFHAAAHKHVPLMELNPLEAVKNNILGTNRLIAATNLYGVENFVMISTDKAVNPTNIMGATKRVAEFLAMSQNSDSMTRFTTVRFGNVLGSNGSVVNTFREQINRGGPITVTHPDITRYFMLIPEAVNLVLIAGSTGRGGEIYVLEMGEPVRIVELAENLIRLSGLMPYEDIQIEFIGLRPGEKLFEELFDESERTVPSLHEKMRIAVPTYMPTSAKLSSFLKEMEEIVETNDVERIFPALKKIVPSYSGEHCSE